MKKFKIASMFLAAGMLVSMLAACGGSGSSSAAETPPAADETSSPAADEGTAAPSGTVRIFTNVTGGKDDAEMALFAEALSEATGLTIEMERPASDYDQVLLQKLNAGEVYDLVQVNASAYSDFVRQGALYDITDYVSASDILTNNIAAQEWADITIDGRVYAGFNKVELHRVVALNRHHLEAIGVDYKEIEPTLEGYYELFKALKEANSDPDYYPFNSIISETWDLQPWFSSVGLKNGVVLDTDGQRYSPYASEEAAEVWEWFKMLYAEGLLDPASFVDATSDMRGKMGAASQRTSVVADWAMWVGIHNANAEAAGIGEDEFDIVSLPGTQSPNGGYMLGKGGASLFAVPANAQNVEGAIAVLEYFATQEGGDLLSIGIEGHDYTVENGEVVLTDIGAEHAKDHGAPVPIYTDWVPRAGLNRGVEEGLTYLQYASIDLIIPNEKDWKDITGKWAVQMIRGDVSIEDGLESMNAELIGQDVVDK